MPERVPVANEDRPTLKEFTYRQYVLLTEICSMKSIMNLRKNYYSNHLNHLK